MMKPNTCYLIAILCILLSTGIMIGYHLTARLDYLIASLFGMIIAVNYLVLARLYKIERRRGGNE